MAELFVATSRLCHYKVDTALCVSEMSQVGGATINRQILHLIPDGAPI